MDTRDYENPFASREEEIGQENVPVGEKIVEEQTLRKVIRKLIRFK